jgi:hypothetical protein
MNWRSEERKSCTYLAEARSAGWKFSPATISKMENQKNIASTCKSMPKHMSEGTRSIPGVKIAVPELCILILIHVDPLSFTGEQHQHQMRNN